MNKIWKRLTALALCAAMLSGCGSGAAAVPAEKEAEAGEGVTAHMALYPESASYPREEDYRKADGEIDWDAFDLAMDAWAADRSSRQDLAEENLEEIRSFLRDSASVFLGGDDRDNYIYSPLNVYIALGLLAEITEGESRQQILEAAHVSSLEEMEEKIQSLFLAAATDDGASKCLLGNSLWLSSRASYKEETVSRMTEKLYASVFEGTFGSAEMDQALRDWINEMTGNLLEDSVKNIQLDPATLAALCSTLYYKARWSDEFSAEDTKEKIFHGRDGDKEVMFMHANDTGHLYFGEHFTAYEKYFVDGGSMLFVLPAEGTSPADLLKDPELQEFLTLADSSSWENAGFGMVHADIPRFDLAEALDLIPGLKELGITDVFDPDRGDFSSLTDDRGVYVDSASHNTRVKIDEEGIEAAAYTMITAMGAALITQEYDFTLDRPFVFAVRSAAGIPLFTGVVNRIG